MNTTRKVSFGPHRVANIWFGLPPCDRINGGDPVDEFSSKASVDAGERVRALEVFWPVGGLAMYGLLGGRFQKENSDTLSISIVQPRDRGGSFVSSLAFPSDNPRLGIPEEYHCAVESGVILAHEKSRNVGGQLQINCGVHSDMGSSEVFFKYLGMALFHIMEFSEAPPTDEDLVKSLTQTIPWQSSSANKCFLSAILEKHTSCERK